MTSSHAPLHMVPDLLSDLASSAEPDVATLLSEIEGLKAAMDSRAPIEQAKGALMARYGIDQDPAFRVMVRWSSLSNVPVREVARVVLDVLTRHPHTTESAFADTVRQSLATLTVAKPVQGPGGR